MDLRHFSKISCYIRKMSSADYSIHRQKPFRRILVAENQFYTSKSVLLGSAASSKFYDTLNKINKPGHQKGTPTISRPPDACTGRRNFRFIQFAPIHAQRGVCMVSSKRSQGLKLKHVIGEGRLYAVSLCVDCS